MGLLKLDPMPDFSYKLSRNRWADYVELLCLSKPDKEISLSDVLPSYDQENYSGKSGDEDHGQKMDDMTSSFLEIFDYIFTRKKLLTNFYPFERIDKDTIKISDTLDDDKFLYLYLLFASNPKYFSDSTIPSIFYTSFERTSKKIMEIIYPNFENDVFGTSSKKGERFYGGKLIDRFYKLADCLNTSVRKKTIDNPRYQSSSGDDGLDVVSFNNVDKNTNRASRIPLCFAQCTCSYEKWEEKQFSVKHDWAISIFEDIPYYHEYLFVPFPMRSKNGNWSLEDDNHIYTIIIDRFRFLNILSLNNVDSHLFLDNDISIKMKKLLGEIDVTI